MWRSSRGRRSRRTAARQELMHSRQTRGGGPRGSLRSRCGHAVCSALVRATPQFEGTRRAVSRQRSGSCAEAPPTQPSAKRTCAPRESSRTDPTRRPPSRPPDHPEARLLRADAPLRGRWEGAGSVGDPLHVLSRAPRAGLEPRPDPTSRRPRRGHRFLLPRRRTPACGQSPFPGSAGPHANPCSALRPRVGPEFGSPSAGPPPCLAHRHR